jgi:hypothetical protein
VLLKQQVLLNRYGDHMESGRASQTFASIRVRTCLTALLAIATLANLHSPVQARAVTEIDLSAPYTLATIATGTIPETGGDTSVAIARFDLDTDSPVTDAQSDDPGFLIVISGQLLITDGADQAVGVLSAGDALWLAAGPELTIRSLEGEASYWRAAIGPDASGRALGGTNPYTFTFSGSATAAPGTFTPFVVRSALVQEEVPVSPAHDGESIAYVLSLAGEADVDGSSIGAGEYTSPFFDNPTITPVGGPAYIAVIARSVPVSITS